MAWLLALIAIIAIIGLAAVATSGPATRYQIQNKTEPNDAKAQTNPETNQHGDKQSDSGAEQQKEQNYWKRFVAFVEANDKVVTALSTVVIAAFTLALFVATYLLWDGAEKTAERQLRAYIGPYAMEMTVYPFEGGEFAFIAHVEMRNFGQTPAYEMSSWTEAKIDVPNANPFESVKNPVFQAGGIGFPQAGLHLNKGWQISTADKESLRTREKILFFWGVVKYRDAFNKWHHLIWRMISGEIVVGTGGVYKLGPHPLGYEAD